jgi:hypothetical protein
MAVIIAGDVIVGDCDNPAALESAPGASTSLPEEQRIGLEQRRAFTNS